MAEEFNLEEFFDQLERDNRRQFGLGENPLFENDEGDAKKQPSPAKQILGIEEDYEADEEAAKKRPSKSERQQRKISKLEEDNKKLTEYIYQQQYQLSKIEEANKSNVSKNIQGNMDKITQRLAEIEHQKKVGKEVQAKYGMQEVDALYEGEKQKAYTIKEESANLQDYLRNIEKEEEQLRNEYQGFRKQAESLLEMEYKEPIPQSTGQPIQYSEPVEELMASFPFLDQRNGNVNYSPEAFTRLNQITNDMNKHYKISGRGGEIFGEEYVAELKHHLQNEFKVKGRSQSQNTQSVRMVSNPNPRHSVSVDLPDPSFNEKEQNVLAAATDVFEELGFGELTNKLKTDMLKHKRENDYTY